MIFFGIPLRSRAASKDWGRVEELFNRTLWSVYNQTNPAFKIIVACHDIPTLSRSYDDRVEFLQLNIPSPVTPEEMMVDKGYKVHTIAMRIRELGAGYTMLVDADDMISRRISEFVAANPISNGWISTKGYYYHYGDNYIKLGHKFPNGSSTIVKYSVEDLPYEYDKEMTSSNNNNKFLIRKRHGNIPEWCKQFGRPLSKLPFLASIYVRDTGENHSLMDRNESKFRRLEQFITPRRIIDNEIRDEFSIDWA